jgi:hypothetical protein
VEYLPPEPDRKLINGAEFLTSCLNAIHSQHSPWMKRKH